MCCITFLTLSLALLVRTKGIVQENNGIEVYKCCDIYEMLGSDGKTCVEADWSRNFSSKRDEDGSIIPPLDVDWVRRWLPPGFPLWKVKRVTLSYKERLLVREEVLMRTNVNASSAWNEQNSLDEDAWRKQVVFYNDVFIARPKPGGGMRLAKYCVDAAMPPLAPYQLIYRTICSDEECVLKCCEEREVLVNYLGVIICGENDQINWSPSHSPFEKYNDPEYPYESVDPVIITASSHILSGEKRTSHWPSYEFRQFLFSSYVTCFDYYHKNTTLEAVQLYWKLPRVARGIYWVLRPLCVVSTILLATALLSLACNRNLQRKMHGWCLVSHALCLFGFNVGQVVYYVTMSDSIDTIYYDPMSSDRHNRCIHLALWMYFFLLAAWFWLTIICANIAQGFRLEAVAPIRSGRKQFVIWSIIAWGLPAAMTIACSFLFIPEYTESGVKTLSWYNPSFMEVRVCYHEPFHFDYTHGTEKYYYKYGTTLFYYGPVGCLALCNLVCLGISFRKLHNLKRGTSILRREEDLHQPQKAGNFSSTADIRSDDEVSRRPWFGGGRGKTVDAKTIKLYIKMVLMTGLLELSSEIIIWATTHTTFEECLMFLDFHFPYRSAGYVTDFSRAVCIAWLASPEGGYLGPFLRRLRGGK